MEKLFSGFFFDRFFFQKVCKKCLLELKITHIDMSALCGVGIIVLSLSLSISFILIQITTSCSVDGQVGIS